MVGVLRIYENIRVSPFEIFYDIKYKYVSGQDGVSRACMVAPLCCPFELSPLNQFYRRKLVCSITLKTYELF